MLFRVGCPNVLLERQESERLGIVAIQISFENMDWSIAFVKCGGFFRILIHAKFL